VFEEEALWIEETLAGIDLPAGGSVADVGSSTLDARSRAQPYIERYVIRPLRERGLSVVHVDRKRDPGVDVTVDLTDPSFDVDRDVGRRFDLVLCCSVLSFVDDLERATAAVASMVAPGGHLLVTTVNNFRRTTDPVDNLWRPTPEELAAELTARDGSLELVSSELIRIDDSREYRRVIARGRSSARLGGRFVRVPGWTEEIRRVLKGHRWRQSCALLRRPA
jgi:SAM-dependent methyltransferase